MIRPDGARATAAAIAGATLAMLPGMGHDLPRTLWPIITGDIRVLANTGLPGMETPTP
jgi:hypothetical protein